MSISTILIVILILILALLGVLPVWKHSANYGSYPSGLLGVVLAVVIILFLVGKL